MVQKILLTGMVIACSLCLWIGCEEGPVETPDTPVNEIGNWVGLDIWQGFLPDSFSLNISILDNGNYVMTRGLCVHSSSGDGMLDTMRETGTYNLSNNTLILTTASCEVKYSYDDKFGACDPQVPSWSLPVNITNGEWPVTIIDFKNSDTMNVTLKGSGYPEQ